MSTILYEADGTQITDVGNTYAIGTDATDEKLYLYKNGTKHGTMATNLSFIPLSPQTILSAHTHGKNAQMAYTKCGQSQKR